MTKTTIDQSATTPVTDIAEGINPFATSPAKSEVIAAVEPVVAEVPKVEETPPAVTTPAAEAPKEIPKEVPKEVVPEADNKFANEFSAKAYEYLKEGKMDELLSHLSEQKTLASAETMEAEAAIRLKLKYDNPDFTDEEVQGLFEESFTRPEKPEQEVDELDNEYSARLEKWEKKNKAYENKIARERKQALKYLSAKKSELVLPDIQKAIPQPTAEQIAQQVKDNEAAIQRYHQSIDKGVAEFNGYTTEVEFDEGVKLPISFTVDATEKADLQKQLQQLDVNVYFGKRWLNEDKSFNAKQCAEDVYKLEHFDTITKRMASEGANRRLEEYLKVKRNVDFSGGRQQSVTSSGMSEQDKMADFFFKVR